MTKQCRICGNEFETIKYGGSRQYCFDCVPEGLSDSDRTVYKRNAAKRQGVKILGGKCLKCGDNRSYILNFHHVDKTQKDETPSRLLANSQIDAYFEEIQKCILLCSNCHQEFHYFEAHDGLLIEDYIPQELKMVDNIPVIPKQTSERNENGKIIYPCIDCGAPTTVKGHRCVKCAKIARRTVERPEPKILAQEIINSSFAAVGRKYNVSDNTIRKWCVAYNMPKKKPELIEWLNNQSSE